MSAAVTQAQAKQQRSGSNGEEPQVDGDPQQLRSKAQLTTDNDTNSANANGVTPLMRAAGDGLVDFVQVLLDRGADVNAKRNDGFTSLALAAFFGHSRVVRLLLERGAEAAELTTRSQTSAEMWADVRGFLGIGDLLRETREKKDVQEPAPLPVVLQEHPRFQRPVAEERRQEIGIVEEHENPDTLTLPDGPRAWGIGALRTSLVKALSVEENSDGNSADRSADHVVSVRPEHAATQTIIQPASGTVKTLPEIVDPPPVTVPEFHPGSVFVARISSTWKTLSAVAIVGLIACGIATFGLPQVARVFTGGPKQAVNNTDLPAASNNPGAQTEQSVSTQIETPTAVTVGGTSAPSKAIEETPRDSVSIESSRQSEPDGVQYPTSPGAAKTDQSESGSYQRSRNRVSRSFEKNSGLSDATTPSRASASDKKQETVPAAAKRRQQALDSEPKPAPLSVEASRSRAVPSTAPSNANEGSGGQSTLVITPSSSKTKVIPWP